MGPTLATLVTTLASAMRASNPAFHACVMCAGGGSLPGASKAMDPMARSEDATSGGTRCGQCGMKRMNASSARACCKGTAGRGGVACCVQGWLVVCMCMRVHGCSHAHSHKLWAATFLRSGMHERTHPPTFCKTREGATLPRLPASNLNVLQQATCLPRQLRPDFTDTVLTHLPTSHTCPPTHHGTP